MLDDIERRVFEAKGIKPKAASEPAEEKPAKAEKREKAQRPSA